MSARVSFGSGSLVTMPAFDLLVEEAWTALSTTVPPEIATAIADVEIGIEDAGPPNTLGLYVGPPLGTERQRFMYTYGWPRRIVLYEQPIRTFATATNREIRDVIDHVLRHEVGHALGMDHDALARVGL